MYAKERKTVFPISTLYYDDKIYLASGYKHMTEIVTFYNCTKVGVDS
jgi:hypothetical protein